jgi:hypothetical protein
MQHERLRQQSKAATIAAPMPMPTYDDNFSEKPEYILLLIQLELI